MCPQGSGWVINGIGNMNVDYFAKRRSMKTYRKFVEWPVGVSRREHVVSV